MGWLVRLQDETTETSRPDVMREAQRQLASKIARVLLPIAQLLPSLRKRQKKKEPERPERFELPTFWFVDRVQSSFYKGFCVFCGVV